MKSFVYEGRPDNEAIDTFTFEDVGHDTLVRCRTVHSSVAARDAHAESGASRGLAESYQRQEELLAALQKGTPSGASSS